MHDDTQMLRDTHAHTQMPLGSCWHQELTKTWTPHKGPEATCSSIKLIKELHEAQAGLAHAQEIFWDLNVPGDPVQCATERLAEANRWRNFRTKLDEAHLPSRASFLQQQKKVASRKRLESETRLSRAPKREANLQKTSSTRTVSSRLEQQAVNQTNSKTGSACGSTGTSPALLTTPVKAKKQGPSKRKHIRKAKVARAPIGTPGTHAAKECPELKARADAKAAAEAQVRSRAETLKSSPGTPSNWKWDQIVTEDNLC
eukprot:544842-Rhodomonas_salina.1